MRVECESRSRRRNLGSATKTCTFGIGPLLTLSRVIQRLARAPGGPPHDAMRQPHSAQSGLQEAAEPTSKAHLVYQRRDCRGCSNMGSCARQGSPREFCGPCPAGPWLPRILEARTIPCHCLPNRDAHTSPVVGWKVDYSSRRCTLKRGL